MQAKKHLGQHFLKSESALRKILEAGQVGSEDSVLEIGPGTGALTDLLVGKAKKVVAIEKDRDLIPLLEEKYSQYIADNSFELIEADILKFDPSLLSSQFASPHYKLIANIPYYITGAIIEKFLSTPFQPECIVILIQKEVAERIIARDSKESILSIAVKAYGVPKIIAKVPPGSFVPPPTVDSAILLIEGITRDFFVDADEALFFKVLKGVFGKKRKQIGGSLAELLGDKEKTAAALEKSGIDSKTRPEDISLATWKKLTQALQ
ncbi:MAG: 16S rRNA (adenine(1518)-N(6)/adenine(1519)-N(6))-dimethyltransferase RsmA [Candidatus Paceibacterota bacterium]